MRKLKITAFVLLIGMIVVCFTAKLKTKTRLLVPIRDVGPPTIIEPPDKFFAVKEFFAFRDRPELVQDPESLRGKVPIRWLEAGRPCTLEDFVDGPDLSLPVGTRAVSITIPSEETSFFLPGTRVDMIGSDREADEPARVVCKMILQDVKVLGLADVVTGRTASVTVALTLEERTLLRAAEQRGPIHVLVRKFPEYLSRVFHPPWILPPETRGMTIRAVPVGAGMRCGTRIDIHAQKSGSKTTRLLMDVELLAVNTLIQIAPQAYTIAVKPGQAEELAAAVQTGPIYIALRRPDEKPKEEPPNR